MVSNPKTTANDQTPTLDPVDTDKFAEMLEAIQASQSALEGQMGRSKLRWPWSDKISEMWQIVLTEGRLSQLEDTVKELQFTVQRLSATTGALEFRAEDAENRAR